MDDSDASGTLQFWTLDLSRRKQRRKKFKFKWIVDPDAKNKIKNVTMRRTGVSYVPRRRARPRLNPGLRLPGASELVFSDERGDEDGSAVLNQFGGIFDDPNHTAESRTHKQRREQEENNWQKVRPDLLRHMLAQESRRKERAELQRNLEMDTLKQDVMRNSSCPACGFHMGHDEVVEVPVVWVITLDFCHRLEVPVFKCPRCMLHGEEVVFHVHPIELGAFPSTPVRPFNLSSQRSTDRVVLYSIELLGLLRDAVDACPRLGVNSFARLLSKRIANNGDQLPISEDYLRKQLGKAFNEYTVADTYTMDPSSYSEFYQNPLAICPACLGSQEYLKATSKAKIESMEGTLSSDVLQDERCFILHSVYIDGHFGIPHFQAAGKSSSRKPALQIKLIPDELVGKFMGDPRSTLQGNKDASCANFTADAMLARTSKTYDRTGIAASICRHGNIWNVLNMATGERWCYASQLLEWILLGKINTNHDFTASDSPYIILPQFLWYDINCRFKEHAKAWGLAKRDVLGHIADWVGHVMQYPLPSFHHSMHVASCQWNNSFKTMVGAGLGVGEPPEYTWSQFRRAGHILQYQSLAVRAIFLERMILLWNQSRRKKIIAYLGNAYVRACSKIEEKGKEILKILLAINQGHASQREKEDVIHRRPDKMAVAQLTRSNEVEYAEAILRFVILKQTNGLNSEYIKLLFGDSIAQKFDMSSPYAQKVEQQLKTANSKLPPGWHTTENHRLAICSLWIYKMKEYQVIVVEEQQKYRMLECLVADFRTRQKDTRKLLKNLKAQKKVLQEALSTLVRICEQTYRDCSQVLPQATNCPEEILESSQEAEKVLQLIDYDGQTSSMDELFRRVSNSEYPWLQSVESGIERYRVPLHMAKDYVARANEEKALIIHEIRGCEKLLGKEVQHHRDQISRLNDAIDGLLEETELLISSQDTSLEAWQTGKQLKCTYKAIAQHQAKIGLLDSKLKEAQSLQDLAQALVTKIDRCEHHQDSILTVDLYDDYLDSDEEREFREFREF